MNSESTVVKLSRAKIILVVSIIMLIMGPILLWIFGNQITGPALGALMFVFGPFIAMYFMIALIMFSISINKIVKLSTLLVEETEDNFKKMSKYKLNTIIYIIMTVIISGLSTKVGIHSLLGIIVCLFLYAPFRLIEEVNKYKELKYENSKEVTKVISYAILVTIIIVMSLNSVKSLVPQTYGMNLYLQENYRDAETDDNLIASKDSKKVYYKDFGTYVAVDLIESFGYSITPDGSDYIIKNNIVGKEISTRSVEKIKVEGVHYFDLYDITNELEPYGVHAGSSTVIGRSEEDTRIETIIKFKKTIPKYLIEVINNAEDSHITYPISDELIYHSNRFEYQEYEPEYYELPDVNIAYAPISVYEIIGINVKQTESGFDFSYGDVDTTLEKDSEDVIYYFDEPKVNIETVCNGLGLKVEVMFNPYVNVLDEYANDGPTLIIYLD